MSETAYLEATRSGARLKHHYGDRVHILADPYSMSLLARLCHPDCYAPEFHRLLTAAYRHLLITAFEQLPLTDVKLPTRMTELEPKAEFVGRIADPKSPVVVVDIARGGILPSHICQMMLLELIDHTAVRVDHVYLQRVAEGTDGHITGATMTGSKIGGGVQDATVLVPDPMGATGTSIVHVLEMYRDSVDGEARKVVCCHLMVTPEYLRKVTTAFPDAEIYALRVDRGMSAPDVLAAAPGLRWNEERGLTDSDYIVPGAGGLGELIYNSFV